MGKQANGKKGVGAIVLLVFVGLLFAAVVGYGLLMAYSINKVSTCFAQATTSYDQMKADIERKEYASAQDDAREAAKYTSDAAAEMEGWQWDVAAVLPVLGTDVRAARSLGTIANDLSQKAVLPVLDAWDSLTGDGIILSGQIDILKVPAKINQIVNLIGALKDASATVDECKARISEVPESHFDGINECNTSLTEAIASADESFEQFDEVVQAVEDATSALTGLIDL